jgi:uncharacterized lipoprotein YajG
MKTGFTLILLIVLLSVSMGTKLRKNKVQASTEAETQSGCSVKLYQDAYFYIGAYLTVNSNIASLSNYGFNDKVSALIVSDGCKAIL